MIEMKSSTSVKDYHRDDVRGPDAIGDLGSSCGGGFDEIAAGHLHGSRGYQAVDRITSLKGLSRADQIGKIFKNLNSFWIHAMSIF